MVPRGWKWHPQLGNKWHPEHGNKWHPKVGNKWRPVFGHGIQCLEMPPRAWKWHPQVGNGIQSLDLAPRAWQETSSPTLVEQEPVNVWAFLWCSKRILKICPGTNTPVIQLSISCHANQNKDKLFSLLKSKTCGCNYKVWRKPAEFSWWVLNPWKAVSSEVDSSSFSVINSALEVTVLWSHHEEFLKTGIHLGAKHRIGGVGRDLWRSSPTLSGKRIRISVKPQHRLNKGRACPPDYRGQNCSVAHKVLQNGATAAWFEWLTLWFPRWYSHAKGRKLKSDLQGHNPVTGHIHCCLSLFWFYFF